MYLSILIFIFSNVFLVPMALWIFTTIFSFCFSAALSKDVKECCLCLSLRIQLIHKVSWHSFQKASIFLLCIVQWNLVSASGDLNMSLLLSVLTLGESESLITGLRHSPELSFKTSLKRLFFCSVIWPSSFWSTVVKSISKEWLLPLRLESSV